MPALFLGILLGGTWCTLLIILSWGLFYSVLGLNKSGSGTAFCSKG